VTDAKLLPGFEERRADVKGVRLRYFVGGSGPPLILVHGLGGSSLNWTELAPLLARRRRVLVPDLPGHGRSSALPAAPTLNPYADVVALVAAREGMVPAPVVGHSMGGVVALRLAIRSPEAVSAVVLVGVAGISTTRRRAEIAFGVVTAMRPARVASLFRHAIARRRPLRTVTFGYWEASDPAALSPRAVHGLLAGPRIHTEIDSAGWALVRDDPRVDLARVRCPAFVLCGARDRMIPVEDAIEYARRLRAPLRLVPDCGHLVIVERPDASCDAIEEFLAGL
jgi:pimeloyl-ACP methyl ester carboxylesterase